MPVRDHLRNANAARNGVLRAKLLLFGFDVEDYLGHGAGSAQRVAARIEGLPLNDHGGRAVGRSDHGCIRFVVAPDKHCAEQSSESDESCCSLTSLVTWSKFRG